MYTDRHRARTITRHAVAIIRHLCQNHRELARLAGAEPCGAGRDGFNPVRVVQAIMLDHCRERALEHPAPDGEANGKAKERKRPDNGNVLCSRAEFDGHSSTRVSPFLRIASVC